jgi:hypothetical protein
LSGASHLEEMAATSSEVATAGAEATRTETAVGEGLGVLERAETGAETVRAAGQTSDAALEIGGVSRSEEMVANTASDQRLTIPSADEATLAQPRAPPAGLVWDPLTKRQPPPRLNRVVLR